MTTVKQYEQYIPLYGILSVLFILSMFEQDENFEECQKIMTAIKNVESLVNIKLPHVLNEEAITDVKRSYRELKLNEDNVVTNTVINAKKLYEEINYDTKFCRKVS